MAGAADNDMIGTVGTIGGANDAPLIGEITGECALTRRDISCIHSVGSPSGLDTPAVTRSGRGIRRNR